MSEPTTAPEGLTPEIEAAIQKLRQGAYDYGYYRQMAPDGRYADLPVDPSRYRYVSFRTPDSAEDELRYAIRAAILDGVDRRPGTPWARLNWLGEQVCDLLPGYDEYDSRQDFIQLLAADYRRLKAAGGERERALEKALYQIACGPEVWTREQMIDHAADALAATPAPVDAPADEDDKWEDDSSPYRGPAPVDAPAAVEEQRCPGCHQRESFQDTTPDDDGLGGFTCDHCGYYTPAPAAPVDSGQGTPEHETRLRTLLDELGSAEVQVAACYRLREDHLRTDAEYAARCRSRDEAVERVVEHVRETLSAHPAPVPLGDGDARALLAKLAPWLGYFETRANKFGPKYADIYMPAVELRALRAIGRFMPEVRAALRSRGPEPRAGLLERAEKVLRLSQELHDAAYAYAHRAEDPWDMMNEAQRQWWLNRAEGVLATLSTGTGEPERG